jgi:hypothetical protein
MEALRAEAVASGTTPLPSAKVVSMVLSHGNSNGTFLKNAGIPDCSSRSSSCEDELRSQFAAEKEGSAVLQEQMEVLKKDSEATKAEFLKLKQQQEEVMKLLFNNHTDSGTSSQP